MRVSRTPAAGRAVLKLSRIQKVIESDQKFMKLGRIDRIVDPAGIDRGTFSVHKTTLPKDVKMMRGQT